jgi:hypothetical protein
VKRWAGALPLATLVGAVERMRDRIEILLGNTEREALRSLQA